MEVLEDERYGPGQCELLDHVDDRVDDSKLHSGIPRELERLATFPGVAGEQAGELDRPRARHVRLAAERLGERAERACALHLVAAAGEDAEPPRPGLCQCRLDDARLPDAGLAFDEHGLQAARRGLLEPR